MFGSLAGHWTAFVLFTSIALFVGYAVFRIAGQWAAPQGQLAVIGSAPRTRRFLGALVSTALLAAIWVWLWSGFHELIVATETVTLQYHVPPRQHVLAMDDILSAGWEPGPRFTRVFVIRTRDGARFVSMQTSMPDELARSIADDIRARMGLE